jgi:hypothetical protein
MHPETLLLPGSLPPCFCVAGADRGNAVKQASFSSLPPPRAPLWTRGGIFGDDAPSAYTSTAQNQRSPAPSRGFKVMGAVGTEHAANRSESQGIVHESGTESGTLRNGSNFAEAVAAVMSLPLSNAEKAEAVRRLLGQK